MSYVSRTYRNVTEAYRPVLDLVINHGDLIPSRLGKTHDLSTAITLSNPLEMIPFVFGRRANHFGMLAEALWLLSDVEEVKLLETWNSRLAEFSDDGATLFGAYGPRLQGPGGFAKDQLGGVLARFSNEGLETRRAVMTILDKEDFAENTKDFPCNLTVLFKCKDGALDMTVMNRSNDIHWGLFGVNFPQFALLQNYVARRLKVDVGTQTHLSDSLHLYMESEPHKKISSAMGAMGGISRRLNFYKWNVRNVSSGQPFDIFGEGWHHKDERKTVRDVFEYCLNEMGPTRDFGDSIFMATAIPLLILYREVKDGTISRAKAIELLGGRVRSSIAYVNRNSDESLPSDWILACYYTLCHQIGHSRDRYRSAGVATMGFFGILQRFGQYDGLTEGNRKAIKNYLEWG